LVLGAHKQAVTAFKPGEDSLDSMTERL